ncbi:hypothetical protein N8J89_31175 [Crossiella sp. CA-258035]|uniref:hypothetical protein n=1 Tax=Crossiella sp. CA-258035 TaxID=2981138 RepID=UPI0024BC2141|nr:hypothetical protein [Crossiella sp. CA-258035]WHT17558.1 hypothetical protein N8J89_31175 [Crossiella sp. CA-258035]
MLTAWDGYARVDYLPIPGRVQVTLTTVEPTAFRRLRTGLACAFADDDPGGPPTYVEVDIGFGLTDDERVLLGESLLAVVDQLLGDGGGSTTTRLDLGQVAALAQTWAPYREAVLSAEPGRIAAGTWVDGLWTRLSGLGLLAALRATPLQVNVSYRGEHHTGDPADVPPEEDVFTWHDSVLPTDLAARAGVEPVIRWTTYRAEDVLEGGAESTGVVVHATALPAAEARLEVALDDGSGEWVTLGPEPGVPLALAADLPLAPDADEPALRFRTDRRTDGRPSDTD